MLDAFTEAANTRSLFMNSIDTPVLADCMGYLPREDQQVENLTENVTNPGDFINWSKQEDLEGEVIRLFRLRYDWLRTKFGSEWHTPRQCFPMTSFRNDGALYRSHLTKTEGDSLVFFESDSGEFVPGRIRQIFFVLYPSSGSEAWRRAFFFTVHRFEPVSEDGGATDPFHSHPYFKAGIRSDTVSPIIELVEQHSHICSAIKQQWQAGTSVFKQLERVRSCFLPKIGSLQLHISIWSFGICQRFY